jgi:hypothetical protein
MHCAWIARDRITPTVPIEAGERVGVADRPSRCMAGRLRRLQTETRPEKMLKVT